MRDMTDEELEALYSWEGFAAGTEKHMVIDGWVNCQVCKEEVIQTSHQIGSVSFRLYWTAAEDEPKYAELPGETERWMADEGYWLVVVMYELHDRGELDFEAVAELFYSAANAKLDWGKNSKELMQRIQAKGTVQG